MRTKYNFSALFPRFKNGLVLLFEKLYTTMLGPAIAGVLVFGLFFDFSIVEPANTAWLMRDNGDGLQSYIGSVAFRMDSWHFPITKTVLINDPEGVCIIYTDSNPLLSILAKIFKFIFPANYQFFGFWYLVCWILQSVFGYLIIKKITQNDFYALLAGILFCLLPTQLARLSHINLVAFWIILWAFYIFINKKWSKNKKQFLFFSVLITASLIHAYFLLMVLFIAATWYVIELIRYIKSEDYRSLIKFLITNGLLAFMLCIFLWLLGYFYNLEPISGLAGYGYFSMNLNAPFSAIYVDFSNFMHGLPAVGGQYEGFQYLGFGFLLLLLFVSLLAIKKDKPYSLSIGLFYICFCSLILFVKPDEITFLEKVLVCLFLLMYGTLSYALHIEKQKELAYLYIPATLCFIYALSNKIMLGTATLFEFIPNDNAWYIFFLQSGRSSGRFFWVTALLLLIAALYLLHKYFENSKKSIGFLSVIVLIQYSDVCVDKFVIASNNREYKSALDYLSKKQIIASRSVQFVSSFDNEVAAFALLHNRSVNKFSIARESGALTKTRLKKETQDFNKKIFNPTVLYLIDSPSDLPVNMLYNVHRFHGGRLSVTPASYHSLEDTSVFIKHKESDSLSTLINHIRTSPLVLIVVKDEASGLLPEFFKKQLDSLYKSKIGEIAFRDSYIAVFSYGKLVNESLDKEHAIKYKEHLLNYDIELKSAGYNVGNEAIIRINGIDLSFNMTGLNVLVLESQDNIWDAYYYNTFTRLFDN